MPPGKRVLRNYFGIQTRHHFIPIKEAKKPIFFKQTPDLEKVPDVDVYRYVFPLVQLHPRESNVQTASEATVCTPAEPALPFRTVGAAGEGQGTGSG